MEWVIRDREGNDAFNGILFATRDDAWDYIRSHVSADKQEEYIVFHIHDTMKDILDVIGDC